MVNNTVIKDHNGMVIEEWPDDDWIPTTTTGGTVTPSGFQYSELNHGYLYAPAENFSDGEIIQWDDDGPYYSAEDYMICKQHEMDMELLHSQVELRRMERAAEEEVKWNAAFMLLLLGILIFGLSVGAWVAGLVG